MAGRLLVIIVYCLYRMASIGVITRMMHLFPSEIQTLRLFQRTQPAKSKPGGDVADTPANLTSSRCHLAIKLSGACEEESSDRLDI